MVLQTSGESDTVQSSHLSPLGEVLLQASFVDVLRYIFDNQTSARFLHVACERSLEERRVPDGLVRRRGWCKFDNVA